MAGHWHLNHWYSPNDVPSPDVGQTTATLYAYDAQGAIDVSVVVQFQLLTPPGDDGRAYDGEVFSATSNGAGLLSVALLQSATYRARRNGSHYQGRWVEFDTDDQSSFELPEILGAADA